MCIGRKAEADGAAIGSKTSCPESEGLTPTADIGRCFAHYSESIIDIINGKLKTMLKKRFLVMPEQLDSMKGGVNEKTNNIIKEQKRQNRPSADMRATTGMD
jgi:hypothetical protein